MYQRMIQNSNDKIFITKTKPPDQSNFANNIDGFIVCGIIGGIRHIFKTEIRF